MKGIFITGTDTDVGKTVVTARLLTMLRSKGIDAIPMKPIQTGCIEKNKKLIAPDLEFSLTNSGMTFSEEEMKLMSPFKYIPACSPHLAGNMSGSYPYIKDIMTCLNKLSENRDLVLVEGAGGTMVPLNDNEMMIDLIKETKFPVILVSHTCLGTINHTLLTINQLRAYGIEILGVVFNNMKPPVEENTFIYEDNIKTIKKFGNVNILGVVDYIEDINEYSDSFFDKAFDFDIIRRYMIIQ